MPASCPVAVAAIERKALSKNSPIRSVATTRRMTAVVAGSTVTSAGSTSLMLLTPPRTGPTG